uniref:Uncharacterized protein n=1 Tax=viral metagenome TaxID=1070528 RepID=A0A6C0JJ01_9ZZZZ
METFYIIVLSVATSLLILILTYFGIIIRNKTKGTAPYPPQPPSTCPDYWQIAGDGKSCLIPENNKKNAGSVPATLSSTVGTANYTPGSSISNQIDFKDDGWTAGGKSGICTKRTWANNYGVAWDGVTNYNGCG